MIVNQLNLQKLNNYGNPNSIPNSEKNSIHSEINDVDLFFISIKDGNSETILKLISNENFDFINIKDQDEHSPLHFSAYCNNYELTELLLIKMKERLESIFAKQGEESLILFERNSSMNSSFGLFNNSSKRENFFSSTKKSSILESPNSHRMVTEDDESKKSNKNQLFHDSFTFSSNCNILSDNVISSNGKKNDFSKANILPKFNIFDEKIKKYIKDTLNKKSINGDTALHFAAENDNIDLLKLLIQYGADINVKNNKNQTILHFALKTNLYKNFIFLHDSYPKCFDLSNDKDFNNQTYLHYACKQELILAVKYLIFNNANLNSLDCDFRSPIFYAVERGRVIKINKFFISIFILVNLKIENIPLIRKLILCGADTRIVDTYGNNLLRFAENSRSEVKDMLRTHFSQLDASFDCSLGIGLKALVKSKTNFYLFMVLHIVIWIISFFCLLPCK